MVVRQAADAPPNRLLLRGTGFVVLPGFLGKNKNNHHFQIPEQTRPVEPHLRGGDALGAEGSPRHAVAADDGVRLAAVVQPEQQ